MRQSIVSQTIICLCVLDCLCLEPARGSEVCEHWLSGPLHNQLEGIPATEVIDGSAIWSPATGGTFLVVGGSFVTIGGTPANFVAGWDGASWRDLGGGVNGAVWTVAVYNNELIVGGRFTAAGPGGSVPAINIARYDGSAWHDMAGGLDSADSGKFCGALAVYNGDLIAAGRFQMAGGLAATNIARWNGTTWSAMGSGVGIAGGTLDGVNALRVHTNNVLYIGGQFEVAGGVSAANIVQFNGSTYAALGSGTGAPGGDPQVVALHSFGNDLVVGGRFTTAGGLSANKVARWTPGGEFGGSWGTLGAGPGGHVFAFQPFNGQLVAGGQFPGAVSVWNGSTWTIVGGGMSGGLSNLPRAFTFNVFNSNLIAAGTFFTAGGTTASGIAQWNLSNWSALQTPAPQVLAFETLGSRFIAAGSFLQSTTSQTPAHNIIGWNGTTLTRVQNNVCCGEGTNGTIRALKGFTAAGLPQLIVGGDFTIAGDLSANRIAQYIQSPLPIGGWNTMGVGFNNSVQAIERYNNATHAGGLFTQSGGTGLNRIARFDSPSGTWIALGAGLNGPVNAMKVFNGFLYVGGSFTTAGGISTGCLARWNGTTWSSYNGVGGIFLVGSVSALEVHNNKLYAGTTFGSQFHVLEIDGTPTSAPSVGSANGAIMAMKSDAQHLYAIGGFTSVGGVSVNKVARWNATDNWSNVEGGTNDVVNSLGLYRGEIQVGLGISLSDSEGGGEPAPQPGKGWVRYSPTGVVWLASNPINQTLNCGTTASFTAQPAQGYSLLLASWHKNGVPLSDGPTGHGSTISGAHSSTLTITGVRTFDAGSYACSFSNICGAAFSTAATLTVNSCCDPDVNNDFEVDIHDVLACISQWGACLPPPSLCTADIEPVGGNNSVNISDLLLVISGWGRCP